MQTEAAVARSDVLSAQQEAAGLVRLTDITIIRGACLHTIYDVKLQKAELAKVRTLLAQVEADRKAAADALAAAQVLLSVSHSTRI